jgi:hypothetical protein
MPSYEEHNPRELKDVGGDLRMSGKLVARKISSDNTEAIRVADDQQRSSEADVDRQGNLRHSITGKSPRGEEGSCAICSLLVERLNKTGGNWGLPTKPDHEYGVDCDTTDGLAALHIQVTRLPDRSMWAGLGRHGAFSKKTTVEQAADDLRQAIRHKQSIPPLQRSAVTLAIDAMDVPGHAVPSVAEVFRKRHGAEVSRLGFQSIWVVGPTADLVEQLDRSLHSEPKGQ